MVRDTKTSQKCVGLKQSKEAVIRGKAKKALIALDADSHIKEPFLELCAQKGVQIEFYKTKAELGKACGINVGASCAVILL